ncbi:MAG TPA: hypothetical protein VFZ16_13100 [Hyphomicrobiaceae bacterium]|nr:hypothetical protein [Hyphomicrobiaceae bacterium]
MGRVIVAVGGFLIILVGVLANLAEISSFVMSHEAFLRRLLWLPPAAMQSQESPPQPCTPGKTALNKLICEDKLEDRIELSRQQPSPLPEH